MTKKNEGVTSLCEGQSPPVSMANYTPNNKKKTGKKKTPKRTRFFPVGVGIRAESPCLLTRGRHINRVLACGLRLFTSNQTSKKESSLLLKWTPLIR